MIEYVIFDTGTLISAFQSDAIPVLRHLILKAYTGPVCLEELKRLGWAVEIETMMRDGFLTISDLNEGEKTRAHRIANGIARCSRNKSPAIHKGESEVIAMALGTESRGDLVLLDERAARSVASREGTHYSEKLIDFAYRKAKEVCV